MSTRHLMQPHPKQEGQRLAFHNSLATTRSHDHLPTSRWQDSGPTVSGVDQSRFSLALSPPSQNISRSPFLSRVLDVLARKKGDRDQGGLAA